MAEHGAVGGLPGAARQACGHSISLLSTQPLIDGWWLSRRTSEAKLTLKTCLTAGVTGEAHLVGYA